ncbi:MAG: hypothetical protein BRC46_04420 [Cyanobacteria bacterium QS_6_48_18]|nr:MAG: hypothetical protein BRC46_04420 [Cyanobacteria bacterium QS_6_48_18]
MYGFGQRKQTRFSLVTRKQNSCQRKNTALSYQGYQGIHHYHLASKTPHQNTKKKPLTWQDKEANSQLAPVRVTVEHVITSLKIFRILSSRYRNRRKRFGLRVNLLAGV